MLSKEAPAKRLKLTFFAQAVHPFPVAGMAIIDELTVARQPFEKLTLELRAMGYRKLSARPATTPKLRALWRFAKKLVHARLDEGGRCRENRNLVPGRGPHRLEEQDHSC